MIIKGTIKEPQKAVIYGPQGVGKTSLAALMPSPLFLDTERGTRRMAVDRIEIEGLDHFRDEAAKIPKGADYAEYRTIVVDTIDWLESRVKEHVVSNYSMKDRSYGREESFIADEMMKLLAVFTPMLKAGKHVVLLAHSATVKIELPDVSAAFDRYELDMGKKYTAPLVKHWADHLIFLKNKIAVREVEDGKNKGVGKGTRILCTATVAAYDAKIRTPDKEAANELAGEFPVKTPEEGIAIVKRIFDSVGAPWDSDADAGEKPAPKKKAAAKKKVARDEEPDADSLPGVPDKDRAELDRILGPHAEKVNAFLLARKEIGEGDTYLDASASYRRRILAQPDRFLKVATA